MRSGRCGSRLSFRNSRGAVPRGTKCCRVPMGWFMAEGVVKTALPPGAPTTGRKPLVISILTIISTPSGVIYTFYRRIYLARWR